MGVDYYVCPMCDEAVCEYDMQDKYPNIEDYCLQSDLVKYREEGVMTGSFDPDSYKIATDEHLIQVIKKCRKYGMCIESWCGCSGPGYVKMAIPDIDSD